MRGLPAIIKTVLPVLLYIPLVLMLCVNANRVLPDNPASFVHYTAENTVLAHIVSSDSVHYLKLAAEGYASNPVLAAFFPLFPLLTYLATFVTSSFVLSGFIISWLALLGAVLFLHKLLEAERLTALQPIVLPLMLTFPTSFFLAVPYTESLFLLLTVGCVYFMKSRQFMPAALFGALATATRVHGILLLIFVLFLVFNALRKQPAKRSMLQRFATIGRRMYILFIIPAGLAAYMLHLHEQFGNYFQFYEAQKAWGHFGSNYIGRLTGNLSPISLTALLTLCFGAYQLYRRKMYDYMTYALCLVVPSLIAGNLMSVSRYVLVAFPMFIGLALFLQGGERRRYLPWVVAAGAVIQGYYIALFANGYWVA